MRTGARLRELLGKVRSAGRDESGMTVWEVTVASLILMLGILATFQMFDAAARNTFRGEQTQVAQDRAQRELEEIRSLEYDQVLLTSLPSAQVDPLDPRHRMSGTSFNVSRTGTDLAQVAYNGGSKYPSGSLAGGVVAPGPEHFTSGDVEGDIFRFVVWRDDSTCPVLICPGTQDFKELIVAVRLDAAAISYDRPYVELHTRITDPNDSVISDLPPGGGSTITGNSNDGIQVHDASHTAARPKGSEWSGSVSARVAYESTATFVTWSNPEATRIQPIQFLGRRWINAPPEIAKQATINPSHNSGPEATTSGRDMTPPESEKGIVANRARVSAAIDQPPMRRTRSSSRSVPMAKVCARSGQMSWDRGPGPRGQLSRPDRVP